MLHSFTPETWPCVGNFNEIAMDSKKFGTVHKPLWHMVNFRKALDYTYLIDLGYEEAKFMWLNM